MSDFELKTKNGYDFFVMTSLMQKAIRRGDLKKAAFAVRELIQSGYQKYIWKRLLIISVEDCAEIITREIVALKIAYEHYWRDGASKGKYPGAIFFAKALLLLVKANKNRDADYIACNLFNPELNSTIDITELDKDYSFMDTPEGMDEEIPDYVYDCHTYIGKKSGKTKYDMVISEQNALNPFVKGIFDKSPWTSCKNVVVPDIPPAQPKIDTKQLSLFDILTPKKKP